MADASPRQLQLRQRFKGILEYLMHSVEAKNVVDLNDYDRRVDLVFKQMRGERGDDVYDELVQTIETMMSEDYFSFYTDAPDVLQDYMRSVLSVCIKYLDHPEAFPPDFDDALQQAAPTDPAVILRRAKRAKRH